MYFYLKSKDSIHKSSVIFTSVVQKIFIQPNIYKISVTIQGKSVHSTNRSNFSTGKASSWHKQNQK